MGEFTFTPLHLKGVMLVRPRKIGDSRGYFIETYSAKDYRAAGIASEFVQDNQSLSAQPGTLRGLHFQKPPHAQAKLVRVHAGSVFDVVVDLRASSPTYGQWCAATLTAEGAEQLFVPRGFAHGFCTLESNTVVAYKVDSFYSPASEAGIAWNDPHIGIVWPELAFSPLLSDRDKQLPQLGNLRWFD